MVPEVIDLRASIIVVLPAPFYPKIRVRGLKNSIFSSSKGENDLIPLIASLSIEDII